MNIKGNKVTLRAIEEKDLELLHQWSNDPSINYMLGGWHFPSSMQDQKKWFQSLSLSSNNQRFSVDNEEGELIGMANLVEINWKDGNAFHGIIIGNTAQRGKGYAVDTVMAVERYAFEELRLERLDTTIIAYNEASLNLYLKKCGWKEEGRKKDYYFRKNARWDQVIIGITAQDYFDFIASNNYWNDEA